jgi:protein AbiQ
MKYIFLSDLFFKHFPHDRYPEIEYKRERPYAVLVLKIGNQRWGLPLRSAISHNYCHWTNRSEKCGIDYTKAVLVSRDEFIDETKVPHIRQEEFEALRGKEHSIEVGFQNYIRGYKTALEDQSRSRSALLCKYSTLQYFHDALGIG